MTSSQQHWDSRHRESSSHAPPAPAPFLVESFPLLPTPHPRSRALDLACGAGQNSVWLAERGWPVVAVDFAPAALDRAAALAASRGLRVHRRPLPVEAALSRHPLSSVKAPESIPPSSARRPSGAATPACPEERRACPEERRGCAPVPSARHPLPAFPDRFSGLLLAEADLETSALPAASFDLILCFHYLHRPAFPEIERALLPGGFLLLETFTVGAHAFPCVRPPVETSEAQHGLPEGPHSPDHLLRRNELRSAFPNLQTLFYRECTTPRAQATLLARKM